MNTEYKDMKDLLDTLRKDEIVTLKDKQVMLSLFCEKYENKMNDNIMAFTEFARHLGTLNLLKEEKKFYDEEVKSK